jgi:hypothetical protein
MSIAILLLPGMSPLVGELEPIVLLETLSDDSLQLPLDTLLRDMTPLQTATAVQ